MEIEVYILANNEERLMPYVMRHYTQFAKVILLESNSTDGTVEIARSMGAEIRPLNIPDEINDQIFADVKNNCWKDSKADWVMVVDADEFVWCPNIVEFLRTTEYTAFLTAFYNMYSHNFPTTGGQIYDEVQYGTRWMGNGVGKTNVFKLPDIKEINYNVGCHFANPKGNVKLCATEEIKTLHMRNLSKEFTIERNIRTWERMSTINLQNGWGGHLDRSVEEVGKSFDEEIGEAIRVVMKKVQFKSNFSLFGNPLKLDIETEKNVEVYIDEQCDTVVPEGVIRIIILQEPYRGDLINFYHRYRDTYSYILTYQDALLLNNPKAIKFLGSTSWMQGHPVTEKHFGVSTVVGGKTGGLEGYVLRHEVWRARKDISIPTEFYLSSRFRWEEVSYENELVLGDSKVPLFNTMFHISIENMRINNMFSEKILDCFQSKVVPIYFGCPNISAYFNTSGIIVVNNVQEIIDVCNRLTPDVYKWMLPFIEENNIKAVKWYDYGEQVKAAIRQII